MINHRIRKTNLSAALFAVYNNIICVIVFIPYDIFQVLNARKINL